MSLVIDPDVPFSLARLNEGPRHCRGQMALAQLAFPPRAVVARSRERRRHSRAVTSLRPFADALVPRTRHLQARVSPASVPASRSRLKRFDACRT
jgi:hypothetical protein